jgi:prepilin-type N-terminal cleavage/methylation domain-containing protein
VRNRSNFSESGFSLIDMLVVVALIGIVAGISVPTIINAMDQMRLGQSARDVERELQTAKQRAVSKGRPMRFRFNCPAVGQFRVTELIGSKWSPAPEDSAGNRCSETVYPYPAPDNDPVTRPNLDGPVRRLDPTVAFVGAALPTIEFWPDGTAHVDPGVAGEWPMIAPAGITVTLRRTTTARTRTITVNGLGKILLSQ